MPRVVVILMAGLFWAASVSAQTTQPAPPTAPAQPAVTVQPSVIAQPAVTAQATTRPANRSAEDMLRQMLQPQGQSAQPLQPLPDLPPAVDATSGDAAVSPAASTQPLTHEGTILLDRMGRLTPGSDGKTFEFTLESDGTVLADPPLVLAPNKKLEQLEARVQNSYGDLKLRVSGEIMEYKGRNYLLLSRWSVLPDAVRPLQ